MDVSAADWLGICRRIVSEQRSIFAAAATSAERTVYEGVGEGGDRTLEIDRRCEDVVFAELERLAAEGASFLAVSEERGEVAFGSGGPARVVVDPIDGSLNARRTIPAFAVSIAVASGASMEDVEFGFVHDFGAEEEFSARRGEGARLNGRAVSVATAAERLEVVGIESAEPEWALPAFEALAGKVFRLRVVGAIAISAAYVGAGRFDAMLSLRPCRSVDAAAAQLIAREAGGLVSFDGLDLSAAPLDLESRYSMAAASSEAGLATVRAAQLARAGA
ncbi:MAG TPA: inositol monophosphatase family protein [Solirubrobacterales bacterium]|nr:inositol monophosphatase family protein [Solirubrobacterales bacterium]